MRIYRDCMFAVAGMLAFAAPANAEDCTLKILTSVDTTVSSSGGMLVPVAMAGSKKKLLVDTGGYFSEITPQVAKELGLTPRRSGLLQYDATGKAVHQRVDVRNFAIGNVKASSVDFLVGGAGSGGDGVLGPAIIQSYDVELDFPRNKFSLISQDHCKGQVVHWPASAVAAVPMRVTEAGHIVFPMDLDGHRLQAMLDTSAPRTAISIGLAERIFGLRTRAPTHRFKTLSVEGVTVNNPEIALIANIRRAPAEVYGTLPSTDTWKDAPDLLLGMSTLKHLHVYIAYREKMLYITAGEGTQTGRASGR